MVLNRKQMSIILLWMVLITLSFLFPCWHFVGEGLLAYEADKTVDYQFFLDRPVYDNYAKLFLDIDYKRLLTQIFIISLLAFGGILITSNNRITKKDSSATDKN